jgi:cytochrome c oxidase subunit II
MMRRAGALALLLASACAQTARDDATSAPSPPAAAAAAVAEPVVEVSARRFQFEPSVIHLKLHVPVVIELVSQDREHGFQAPELGIDEVIRPGTPTRVRLVPEREGSFDFHCSVFCGGGHEDMAGQIVVEP